MKETVKREQAAAQRKKLAAERDKLIPAMAETFRWDKHNGLVWAKDVPPRGKKGAPVGSMNGRGTRQVMFNGVRYVAHEIIFAINNGYWPRRNLSFRDGDILNIAPSNLYIKE